jgi:hypothetical protein
MVLKETKETKPGCVTNYTMRFAQAVAILLTMVLTAPDKFG